MRIWGRSSGSGVGPGMWCPGRCALGPSLANHQHADALQKFNRGDTTEAMKDYLSSFDPHLKGLTGTPDQVAKVISAYRVYARKVPLKDGDYTMDHTALIYLMDRDGKFVSPFNLKRTPEQAAADLKHYL